MSVGATSEQGRPLVNHAGQSTTPVTIRAPCTTTRELGDRLFATLPKAPHVLHRARRGVPSH
jgi:hypothetical protein